MTKRERKARAKAQKSARRLNIALMAGGLLAAIITIPVMNYYSTPERIRNCPSHEQELDYLSAARADECFQAIDYPSKAFARKVRKWENGR